jgi:hypothetical protein
MHMNLTPTEELYSSLQTAFEHFNRELFDNELPNVIFTMQRKQKCMGYFSPDRWASSEKNEFCHELAINPAFIGNSSLLTTFQTLVHEQVHIFQAIEPESRKPGRNGYHNKQWASKMEDIGLMPSSTGKPGGKKTGQNMSDYPIKGGPFLDACKSLINSHAFNIPWFDRWAEPVDGYEPSPEILEYLLEEANNEGDESNGDIASLLSTPLAKLMSNASNDILFSLAARSTPTKTKYRCPSCLSNIWGKPGLSVRCEPCNMLYCIFE